MNKFNPVVTSRLSTLLTFNPPGGASRGRSARGETAAGRPRVWGPPWPGNPHRHPRSPRGGGGRIAEERAVSGRWGGRPRTQPHHSQPSHRAFRLLLRGKGRPAPVLTWGGAGERPRASPGGGRGGAPGGGVAGRWEAGQRREPGGEAARGAGALVLSGGRSCSRTARRRLGAARREPRAAGGRGAPGLAACAPGRRPARAWTSSMSSGYSSLEEDAEDFFFTARTSFFKRAPQGKPRAGQQVSVRRGAAAPARGARGSPGGGTPVATCVRGAGMLAGWEEGAAGMCLLPFWIPGFCLEFVLVGVRWGRPGPGKEEGRGGPAGSCLPRQMPSAAPPRAAGSGGAVRGGEASPGNSRRFPRDPGRPSASPQSQGSGPRAGPVAGQLSGLRPPERLGGPRRR